MKSNKNSQANDDETRQLISFQTQNILRSERMYYVIDVVVVVVVVLPMMLYLCVYIRSIVRAFTFTFSKMNVVRCYKFDILSLAHSHSLPVSRLRPSNFFSSHRFAHIWICNVSCVQLNTHGSSIIYFSLHAHMLNFIQSIPHSFTIYIIEPIHTGVTLYSIVLQNCPSALTVVVITKQFTEINSPANKFHTDCMLLDVIPYGLALCTVCVKVLR